MQSLRVLEGAASVALLLDAEQIKKHFKVLGIDIDDVAKGDENTLDIHQLARKLHANIRDPRRGTNSTGR